MKRYQKLIQDAVAPDAPDSAASKAPNKKHGYNQLGRAMQVPSTSVHEWATCDYKVPHYKSLEKIAAYFEVPLPTLIMEADDPLLPILDKLFAATAQEIGAVNFLLTPMPKGK